jgi:hypothetical protein
MSNILAETAKDTLFPADLKKGQLHKDLGIDQKKKIPVAKLKAAAKKKGKVGRRARWALNVRK